MKQRRLIMAVVVVIVITASVYFLFFAGKHSDEDAVTLTVTSESFNDLEAIPVRHTRDGINVNPQIIWTGVPEEARSIAITCVDPDASGGSFTHWIIFNIPSELAEIEENIPKFPILENMVMNGVNDFSTNGYDGPSPPSGAAHRYVFTVYALDQYLDLGPGAQRTDLLAAITGHILAKGTLTGTYQR
ncbi:MAG: YbhB/YbcL family Raf kinase inhibitor-like protein [Candidatus Bathyarchaeota archaeon]|nr:YbhB/YbcL family Raf kinase inhibitor-like protein [Candidatus Bathyarchaeota archaeon]